MKKGTNYPPAEAGFVLVTALIVMLVLTIIGIAATNTAIFELNISGNDRAHKETFAQADAGLNLNERLTFENAVCYAASSSGFTANNGVNLDISTPLVPPPPPLVRVFNMTFAKPVAIAPSPFVVDDANRSVAYYPDGGIGNDTGRHTNLNGTGKVTITPGSALQMVAGYEGLGASAAGGGTHVLYDLLSQHRGNVNSRSTVASQWQLSLHLLNSASSFDCKY